MWLPRCQPASRVQPGGPVSAVCEGCGWGRQGHPPHLPNESKGKRWPHQGEGLGWAQGRDTQAEDVARGGRQTGAWGRKGPGQKGPVLAVENGALGLGRSRGPAEQELGEGPELPLSPQGPPVVSMAWSSVLTGYLPVNSDLQATLPQGLGGSSRPPQDPTPQSPAVQQVLSPPPAAPARLL